MCVSRVNDGNFDPSSSCHTTPLKKRSHMRSSTQSFVQKSLISTVAVHPSTIACTGGARQRPPASSPPARLQAAQPTPVRWHAVGCTLIITASMLAMPRFKWSGPLMHVHTLLLLAAPLAHTQRFPVSRSDIVVALPIDDAHTAVAKAGRAWRKGMRTIIATNSTPSHSLLREGEVHGETWVHYADDTPPLRALYPGDVRAAVVPFLAHKVRGRSLMYHQACLHSTLVTRTNGCCTGTTTRCFSWMASSTC